MKNFKTLSLGVIATTLAIPGAVSAATYTVKSGDTLYGIAKMHNTTVAAIKKLNNLSSNTILVGQVLKVSEESSSETTEYRKVNADELNVRKGPGTSFAIITSIKKNTQVQVLSTESNGWMKVKIGSTTGYVNGKYLSEPIKETTSTNIYHTVVAGDTLWGISSKYNVTVNSIKTLNNLTSNVITVGQKLIIKQATTPESTPDNENNSSGSNGNSSGSNDNSSDSNDSSTITTTTHIVKAGDTLFDIAIKYNTTVAEIKKLNNLSSNIIQIGQKLIIKQTNTSDSTPDIENNSPDSDNNSTIATTIHIVKPGDTLFDIALKYNTTVESIKTLNSLTSNVIYVGQSLVVYGTNPNFSTKLIRPAEGIITSEFGPRNGRNHHGIDIAKNGIVPVVAVADGVVTKSYYSSSYGEVIFIEHTIDGVKYEMVYAHLRTNSRQYVVGDTVKAGAQIGLMGNTGNSTGQHLHFETHKGSWNTNKTNVINPRLLMNF